MEQLYRDCAEPCANAGVCVVSRWPPEGGFVFLKCLDGYVLFNLFKENTCPRLKSNYLLWLYSTMPSMKPYRLSFIVGGLLIPETREIAKAYVRTGDWEAVRTAVMEENLLSKTRKSSRFRYFREIRDKLKSAYDWETALIAVEGNLDTVRLVLLVITARYYPFIFELLAGLVREKLAAREETLTEYNFPSFFGRMRALHVELAGIKESTKHKIEQVSFRILAEAGILFKREKKLILAKPAAPPRLIEQYRKAGDRDALAALLLFDDEMTRD